MNRDIRILNKDSASPDSIHSMQVSHRDLAVPNDMSSADLRQVQYLNIIDDRQTPEQDRDGMLA